MTLFDFSSARVLVTGGSNGIGLGIAQAFAEAGAHVTITGTRSSESDYSEDGQDRGAFDYKQLDLRDNASIDALPASLERLDVLVNNAGSTRPFEEWQPDVFAEAVQINLIAAFRMSVACKPLLEKSALAGGASILNNASMAAYFASAGSMNPGYGVAKAGIVLLTKNLGSAWVKEGIRVNAVAPGLIETNMTSPLKDMPEESKQLMDRTPMERFGKPADVAGPMLFFASAAASYVTGQTLCVDGGFSLA
jgi:NAD(P)-dependent dehydrogenase (short-subunit alcohol dehydrogenase family)